MNVLTIFGTRPEAIKMAPVVKELGKYPETVESAICVTAQHRQMLDQVLDLFQIEPDIDLDLMEENQTPATLTARAMEALTDVLRRVQPDWVLVQGDTTTAMVTALAAFYQQIPVGHIEAGLRTHDRYSPFPEEINRHLISVLATLHFAPTQTAADALRAEGVSDDAIYVTGNTVIDALLWVVQQQPSDETCALLARLGSEVTGDKGKKGKREDVAPVGNGLRTILVTAHRRENFGQPFENICMALREIVRRNPDVQVVYPVHMNPNVREPAHRILNGHQRLHLIEPLPYEPFAHLMNQVYLVLTDSGGIQEEAPALGKPVLVMRRETERPEAVAAGTVKLVGTDTDSIVAETERLLADGAAYERMARAVSPYGDGHAAERIVKILLNQSIRTRRNSPFPPNSTH
jgi:UDP-N-acetylglucosamine 2-epimerase (non-hydrolysing)